MMRKTAVFALPALILAMSGVAEAETTYSMEDLKALVDQENWAETIEHLQDIPPAQRNKDWNLYLEKSSLGLVNSVAEAGDPYNAWQTAEGLVVRYPMLKKSRPYLDRRAEVGVKAMGKCFQARYGFEQCIEASNNLIKVDPDNSELAFELGKLVRLATTGGTAMTFFERALRDKKMRKNCGHEQVKIALSQASGQRDDRGDAMKKVAFEYCWKQLKPTVMEEFAGGSSYTYANLCPGLQKKKALSAFQKAICKDAKS
ncbi:MAG: hypothetical protein AAFV36_01730 [Myxococcota bacterium]